MSKYVIQGGKKLEGEVMVGGAKNAALKMMAAALLSSEQSVLSNVPRIRDVETMIEVLGRLGARASFSSEGTLSIDPSGPLNGEAPYELVSQMRASIIVLGPLLARLRRARVAMPGGCNIGSRKIDLHLKGLRSLGVRIRTGHGYIEAEAENLKGTTIALDFPSVGATENILMAAVLADGKTTIENAAREPELVDLIFFLKKMGAKINGAGTTVIEVEGVPELYGASHEIIPDRIEGGTYLTAGAVTQGEVVVKGVQPRQLELVIEKIRQAGARIKTVKEGLVVSMKGRPLPVDVSTLPYPGFPTDLQPLMATLLSLAEGTSVVTENVFENRFLYIDELNRMGANIRMDGHHAVIKGVGKLSGAPVRVPDLRAGAALVLAGLVADGTTEVADIFHIERGYENFDKKLQALGADIKKEENK